MSFVRCFYTRVARPLSTVALMTASAALMSQEAHVHGVAQVFIAQEGNEVQWEFHSPAYNVLGFEHEPHSDAEKAALAQLNTHLTDMPLLLLANCHEHAREVSLPWGAAKTKKSAQAHDHHNHHQHDHKHHHQHDHDRAQDESHERGHADVSVTGRFHCSQPIASVELPLLTHFMGIEQLQVIWFTDDGQRSVNLQRPNTRVNLR